MIGEIQTPCLRKDVDVEEDNRRIIEELRAKIAAKLDELASAFGESAPS